MVVAPREITDLVYRCARVAGVPVGTAKLLAARWTEAAFALAETGPKEAARHGLAVNRAAFDCLSHSAGAFLVSEQLLDQIAESSPGQLAQHQPS